MKSVTKNRLETGVIERIIKTHFPGEAVTEIKELENGMFNASYFIKGSDKLGGGAVLKTAPSPGTKILTYEKNILEAEVKVYAQLSGKRLPVPKVLVSDFSKTLVNCSYFIMTFVEGTLWMGGKSDKKIIKSSRPGLMRELGKYNAEIHSVTGEWFGYIKEDKSFQFGNWYDAFYSMIQNILADGKKGGCKLPYEKIEAAVIRNKAHLLEVKEPKLVSFDIHAGNVFLKESDGKYHISGIIDFERSFYGDPLADFIASMFIYNDIEKEPDFRKGYCEITGGELRIGEPERKRMNLYRLYLAVIMHVETYRYGKVYAGILKLYTKIQIRKFLKVL